MQIKNSCPVFFIIVFISMGITRMIMAQAEILVKQSFGMQPGYLVHSSVSKSEIAILPLGSIEYHGPSGPSLTDSIIASGIASRVAANLSASIFPVVSFTHSPAHTAVFRGTLSIRPEVVTMLFVDILRGLVSNGFRRILVINGHDGNIGPARLAISQVTHENPKTQMLLVNWWETLPTPEVKTLNLFTTGNGGHGHGGPLELSVAAVFAPESVQAGKGPDLPALEFDASFPFYLEKSDTTGWPGYSGKLSEISAQKGEVLLKISVRKISAFVKKWLKDDSKPGSW